jgi:hypothetical protein
MQNAATSKLVPVNDGSARTLAERSITPDGKRAQLCDAPFRRHALRSSAASTWSLRSGVRKGSAPKRSRICLRALGPAKPWSSSWRTRPVVKTAPPRSNAERRNATSATSAGASRRSASDQTLVSTKTFTIASARACNRIVIPVDPSEELDQAALLAASDELLQRLRDRGGLAALAAHCHGALEELRIDREVRRHCADPGEGNQCSYLCPCDVPPAYGRSRRLA